MEEALGEIKAGAVIAAEETGEPVASFVPGGQDAKQLEAVAARFNALDKLSANLKMGPIQQLVAATDDSVDLAVRFPDAKAVGVTTAPDLDSAYLAQHCVGELLK